MFEYPESYQFKANGSYGLGSRLHGDKLQGKIDWGRYKTRGKNVTATSGPLKEYHYYMVKAKAGNELVLMHNGGKATGIGCYFHKP